jgi:hypothetical protein
MEYLLNHSDKNKHCPSVSSNQNITLNDIQKYPNFPWDYQYLSQNKNLTIQYILNNPDKNWNYNALITHKFKYYPDIYFKFIRDYIHNTPFIIKNLSTIVSTYIHIK